MLTRSFRFTDDQGQRQVYVDRKRALWLLSVVYPLSPVIAVALHHFGGSEWWLTAPIMFSYGLVPFLDWLFGEDLSNPPEQTVTELENDRYYRYLTWLTVPLHLVSLLVAAWWAATAGLSPFGWLVLAVVAGLASGLAVNTAHEMGHKRTAVEQWLSRIALAVPAYGHFTVEHNFGHHKHVATPEDCASARMNESIYHFAMREMPGGLARAWGIERRRLARSGLPAWSPRNTIVQSWAMTLLLQGVLVAVLGGWTLAFLFIHNLVAWFQLTSANYVEHYGLLRRKQPDGEYERCQPHYSWNSNHIFSNLLLFHLERHSDHHAHPNRRYQSLRHFENLPELPTGYLGMFVLAYVPPLWFRLMNPRLLALPHVGGDLSLVNR
ncbi:alkane 1-monooxygenase [Wenzhouxiangella sp. XN201]|uniref:alkane 1-monooxygenase n=1 Tax=Wenzhouxiangella sp. XN201 TaxID=2710755 RepID=UPI0013C9C845|nr:alkane 1-monooxygenase [Wenzhouxiangella sp. XN201]NEZ05213.1 alkane 1-monooxygenase [Wenzhouxiangella sp. XN201]